MGLRPFQVNISKNEQCEQECVSVVEELNGFINSVLMPSVTVSTFATSALV